MHMQKKKKFFAHQNINNIDMTSLTIDLWIMQINLRLKINKYFPRYKWHH